MPWDIFDTLWTDPWRESFARTRPEPAVNVYGDDEKLVVTSEVPGLDVKDLGINVQGRTLTLRGKRDLPELGEDECFACSDRSQGEFTRSITLPYLVETDKVLARYEHGVVTVTLPRAERDKPRKIEVKAA